MYVHLEKGGVYQGSDEGKNQALVQLSGYLASWSRNSSKRLQAAGEQSCDDHCLPRKALIFDTFLPNIYRSNRRSFFCPNGMCRDFEAVRPT